MKIAVFSTKSYDREYLNRDAGSSGISFKFFEPQLNEDTVKLATGFQGVCVFVNDKLDAPVLQKLADAGISLIALRCAGFNNVDLETAKKLKLDVRRVPAYSPEAVAEHALALILTLNRKTHKAYNRIREGNFSLERLTGFDIHGKTAGVIGTGKIGLHFCRIMKGLGCEVLAYDLYPNKDLEGEGITYTTLSDLLAKADILSLHCPLTPDTHHLINKETLSQVKPGAMLINTSRGALIDTAAVIEALKNGRLGYLGIDVYEQEEHLFFRDLSESIIADDQITRLMTFPNVLITAHQGFLTAEALTQIASVTLQNIKDHRDGKVSGNQVF